VRNPKALVVALGVVALIAFGFLFVRGPKPLIEIKGEKLTQIGFFPVINTWVAGVLVVCIVSVFFYLGARRLNVIPRGFQNVVEAIAEALYNLCIQTAGEKNGRRFFPVAATLFVFIWFANWMALTPIFNSFGAVKETTAYYWDEEAHIVEQAGGVYFIWPFSLLGGDNPLVEFEVDESQLAPFEEDVERLKSEGAPANEIAAAEHILEEATLKERENAINAVMVDRSGIEVDLSSCETLDVAEQAECERKILLEPENVIAGRAQFEADGKKFAHIYPMFRSMNTDLNSPLSLAIVAMIFIEFWGITALGVFKYGGKFFRNPITDPIGFVVGILELIAEVLRIISFTFRLFGNMLAGEILLLVMTFLVPFVIALPFYGLEVFVGVVQAFVFFTLTVAFGALAAESHDDHGHDDHGDDGHRDVAEPAMAPAH
jgi:F-type H+-transporting ATPase subunit a